MAERLILRQNNRFETEFLSTDPHQQESQEFKSVTHMHELTPYGLFLAGLAGCTSIVLHTYAQNHGLDLQEVELRLTYDRVFTEDCENCEEIERYTEQIDEKILLVGELDEGEREKLFLVSKQCPIHKIVEDGIEVRSSLVEEPLIEEE
jgi:putative redox protein